MEVVSLYMFVCFVLLIFDDVNLLCVGTDTRVDDRRKNVFFSRTYVCSELSPALPWTCNWVVEPLVIVSSYLDSNYSFLKIFDSFPSLTFSDLREFFSWWCSGGENL